MPIYRFRTFCSKGTTGVGFDGTRPAWACTAVALFTWLMVVHPAEGQVSPYNPVSRIDAYGNAGPTYMERRPTGVFQNEAQQRLLRNYQDAARRTNRRGGLNPFTFQNDSRRKLSTGLSMDLFLNFRGTRHLRDRFDAQKERIYRQYGGFSNRNLGLIAADLPTTLIRPSNMVTASKFNAPIHRAMLGRAGRMMIWPDEVPIERLSPRDLPPTEIRLEDWLKNTTKLNHQTTVSEGWRLFQEGDYRQAARQFEMAYLLDDQDHRSRVGELFCHLTLGALRTARIDLKTLMLSTTDPFHFPTDMANAYGNGRDPLRIRVQLRAIANYENAHPDVRALYASTLWHLGERQESIIVMDALAKDFPRTPYRAWPKLARQALKQGAIPP